MKVVDSPTLMAFSFLFEHRYMPCPVCGASLERSARAAHVCDDERRLDYELVQLRPEILAFETKLTDWLASPDGLFAVWEAERRR